MPVIAEKPDDGIGRLPTCGSRPSAAHQLEHRIPPARIAVLLSGQQTGSKRRDAAGSARRNRSGASRKAA